MQGTVAGPMACLQSFVLRARGALAVLLPFLAITAASSLHAETIHEQATGITITVEQDGHYAIDTTEPVWSFRGKLPTPASALKTASGHDGIGDYDEISFTFGTAREGAIRTYPT